VNLYETFNIIEKFFKIGSKLLFFIPQLPELELSKGYLIQKASSIIEANGRVNLGQLLHELQVSSSDLWEILTSIHLNGIGRFSKDQSEFISENRILNDVGEIILKTNAFKVSDLSEILNLNYNELYEILQNLIIDGQVNAVLEGDIFNKL